MPVDIPLLPSGPETVPPDDGGQRPLFVDALNVAYWCGQPPSLRLPITLIAGLLAAGHDALLCFDASARYQLKVDAAAYAKLIQLDGLAFEVPSGIPADRVLLKQANAANGAILSRDHFRNHRRRYRRLIDDPARVIAGYVRNDRLLLPALALDLPLPATTEQAWALLPITDTAR
ncbi:NYN domain-containing protein [Nevskia ramosa]|uniref:NYN domain-containing protein n=1 Tax=Nevskia ramosa TaxID=64002 RepID=UPI0003B4C82D|nr:hypothetical protein [Nevskia ramosa]